MRTFFDFPFFLKSLAQQSPLVSGRGAGGRRGQHNRLGLTAVAASLLTSSLSHIVSLPPYNSQPRYRCFMRAFRIVLSYKTVGDRDKPSLSLIYCGK